MKNRKRTRAARRETLAAFAASCLLHLAILLLVAASLALPTCQSTIPDPPPPEPVELTILPPEPPKVSRPQFVRTDPSMIEDPTPNAPFESDNNSRAASELPPTGPDPLMPSTEGIDSPALELRDQQVTLGPQPQPAPPPQPDQKPQEAQQPPESKPEATPTPTPPPITELALRDIPKETAEQKQPQKKPERTEQKPAQKSPPPTTGFQPETRVTRLRGSLSNRGKNALEAAATPLGRYKKAISDAIGSRWYYYVNDQLGLLNIGTVEIRFMVMPDGSVKNARVLSNTSNESFASVSLNSILKADIPPIPEDVAKILENSRIEIEYSFTILSN